MLYQHYREGSDMEGEWNDVDNDFIDEMNMGVGMSEIVNLTPLALKLQADVENSAKKRGLEDDNRFTRTDLARSSARKKFHDQWKSFIDDPRVSDEDIDHLSDQLSAVFSQMWDDINKRYPKVGGGPNIMELQGHLGSYRSPAKKTCYGATRP